MIRLALLRWPTCTPSRSLGLIVGWLLIDDGASRRRLARDTENPPETVPHLNTADFLGSDRVKNPIPKSLPDRQRRRLRPAVFCWM